MKKQLPIILYFLNLFILIGLWWDMSLGGQLPQTLPKLFIELGKLAGILATYQALIQLILIGRIKWVESSFGLDKLSRIHKWNGYLTLV
ncbi:MAG: hypothetical protein R3B41_03790 [Candidatus Doudnabacteria bacterium]